MTTTTMDHQALLDACWTYATTISPTEREEIEDRIAAYLKADPHRVAAVLRLHRGRVDGLYIEANGRPSLESLERQDEAVADALAALPEVEG